MSYWLLIIFAFQSSAASAEDARVRAQRVISYQCGACHTGSLPTAKPGALKVFDLENEAWVEKLKKSQKDEILRRLQERAGMSDLEVSYLMPKGWSPLPKRPTKQDIESVRRLLTE